MARPTPKSITDKEQKTSVKDSFKALKTIPRFFREIYRSSPKLFFVNAFSRLLNAFTPVVILWVGKMSIDEIILQVSLPENDFTQLWNIMLIEFCVTLLSDLL